MVTAQIAQYSRAGMSGILLTALEPSRMLDRFAADILPRLEQAGLRRPMARVVTAIGTHKKERLEV
jgi:hypothetical protein